MALGAAGSPDLAERVSEASAKELKLVGMNWVYSPVADVNSEPRNPAIGLFVLTCHCNVL
jgi:beta-N-acetylhexosaminidase